MAFEVRAELLERKMALREPSNLGGPRPTDQLSLEGDMEPEFDLPTGAERVCLLQRGLRYARWEWLPSTIH